MLIIIILAVLAVLFGVGAIVFIHLDNELGAGLCIPVAIVSAVFLLGCSIMCFITQSTKEAQIQHAKYSKQLIELKLEYLDNGVLGDGQYSNADVFNEAIKFNEDIYFSKYYSESIWFNWFNVDLTEVGYIEVNR